MPDESAYREALQLLDDPSTSESDKEALLFEVHRWNANNPELAAKINQEGFSKPTDEAKKRNALNRKALTQMASGGAPGGNAPAMAALSEEVQQFEQQFPEDLGMGKFQVTPNTEHELGTEPWITEARQAQVAEEAEKQGQGPKYNSQLETLSQLDDPRLVRPPEYTNREDASYSIWDIVPAVMGGRAEAWHEPSVEEFRTAKRAEIGDSVDALDDNSEEYRRYADEQWVREYDSAKRDRRPVFRQSIKARKLQGSGIWGALPTNALSEFARDPAGTARTVAEEALGASTAAASKFDDTALLGAGKAATRMLGGEKAAAEAERAAERSDVGATIGAVGGAFTPEAPANLAAAAVYKGAKKLLPKMGGLGRTAAGAAAGAAGAAADVEGSKAVRDISGAPPAEDVDLLMSMGLGGLLGGGLHGVGEFAGSRVARRRDPTVSPSASAWTEADRYGVKPGLTGGIKPPKRTEAIMREAAAAGRDPIEMQAERVMPGMKSAALQKELAHEASPTVTELEEFFNSPEGMKRVNAQRVVDVARKELRILKESAAYASKPRDVEALSGFISDLERSARSGGGPATLNAREVQDAIDGMEARFAPELGFTSKRANSIMQELYRDLFAVRDQFRGAPLDTLAVRLGPPAGTLETPGGKLDARQEVTGLSALMHKRALEHEGMEGFRDVAGLPPRQSGQAPKAQQQIVGKEKGPPGLQMSSAQQTDFKRKIMQFKRMGDAEAPQRDAALSDLASMAGLDKELENIAALTAGENLKRLLQPGNTPLYVGPGGLGLGSVGTVQRLGARLDPAQKALAEEFSPKLLEFLVALRRTGPVRPPLGSPMQPFALRGGAAGAKATNLLTDEDIGNLQALLRTRGQTQPMEER